jgi:hypothetical protein
MGALVASVYYSCSNFTNFFYYGIDFAMILMLVFIGKYPLKYIELLSVLNFISCFFLFLLPKLFLIPF